MTEHYGILRERGIFVDYAHQISLSWLLVLTHELKESYRRTRIQTVRQTDTHSHNWTGRYTSTIEQTDAHDRWKHIHTQSSCIGIKPLKVLRMTTTEFEKPPKTIRIDKEISSRPRRIAPSGILMNRTGKT